MKVISIMFKIFTTLFLITFFFISCKDSVEENTDAKFKLFNLNNAGWKSKTLSHNESKINYKATQVPLQYYILKNGPSEDPIVVDSIYRSHSKERIIEFEFQHDTKDDLLKAEYTKMDYTKSIKYMSFNLKEDFELITNSGERIKCSGVTFERNFKVAPYKRALLHFANVPENDNVKLLYRDKLFGNGLFKYNFNEAPIKL